MLGLGSRPLWTRAGGARTGGYQPPGADIHRSRSACSRSGLPSRASSRVRYQATAGCPSNGRHAAVSAHQRHRPQRDAAGAGDDFGAQAGFLAREVALGAAVEQGPKKRAPESGWY